MPLSTVNSPLQASGQGQQRAVQQAAMKRQRDDYGGNQYGHDGGYGQVPKRQQQG